MTDKIYKQIDIKMDRLESKYQTLAELSELAGRQEALASIMSEVSIRRIDSKRKTIDIDTVQQVILNKLQSNTNEIDKLMKRHKGFDKVIDIQEHNRWTELK